ncbi:hypothetical protein TOC8172_22770 [Pseudomonas syringae]
MPNAQIEAAQMDKNKERSFDDIWPKVTELNLYDLLTLMASVPGAAKLLFKPKATHSEGFGVLEQVGPDDVTHPEKAKLLMSALSKSALVQSTAVPD